MPKKYIVKLRKKELKICDGVVARLSGSSQKVRRSQILRQADINGPAWTDEKIAAAYHCRTRTVENLRRRFVEEGFTTALHGKKRVTPPQSCILDGAQEAKLIATRLGSPPKGFGSWSLRLLANQAVELEITDSISHETCRNILKKTA